MISIGEINVFVSDFDAGLRFWAEGLGLEVAERDRKPHTAHARLEFADGSPSIRLFWPAEAWPEEGRPEYGTRPMVGFDITTDEFEATLARLLDCGGVLAGEVQHYDKLRFAFVADPDGNTIELVEVPDAAQG